MIAARYQPVSIHLAGSAHAPVVPGEIIELEFILRDAGDHNVDSLVLLDRFRWNVTPSAVQIHNQPPRPAAQDGLGALDTDSITFMSG
ncbi:hypothetical protein WMF37_06225 [Sorangium sp. So ce291]|uniref:hypothetical protein n=1 Tax=Sorangium sp. So ce291 TaxID=3133294 RepID=UPI003F63EBB8